MVSSSCSLLAVMAVAASLHSALAAYPPNGLRCDWSDSDGLHIENGVLLKVVSKAEADTFFGPPLPEDATYTKISTYEPDGRGCAFICGEYANCEGWQLTFYKNREPTCALYRSGYVALGKAKPPARPRGVVVTQSLASVCDREFSWDVNAYYRDRSDADSGLAANPNE